MGFLYFGTPSSPAIRQAMNEGRFGCMTSPAQGNQIPEFAAWAGDNGRFGNGWPGHIPYLNWLAKLVPVADRCAFVLAPDVPFDMAATLEFSAGYVDTIRGMGFPVALALQNGAENLRLPWDDYDAVFLAGDTQWKLDLAAAELAQEGIRRGLYAHMGRCNSAARMAYARGLGLNSADGTTFAYGPDENSEDMARWGAELDRKGVQGLLF